LKEREKILVSALMALLLVVWLGLLVHRSPRFAGSAWGGFFGVTGALLMLVPLAYSAVKRVPLLKRVMTRHVRLRTWLSVHIYAGIVGPLFVLIHTGHKFDSPLGAVLTALTLVVVVSGFVGRYLMGAVGKGIREKQALLREAQTGLQELSTRLADQGAPRSVPSWGRFRRALASVLLQEEPRALLTEPPSPRQALQLAESISDLEHAIGAHETLKRAFATWLRLHISLSVGLYILLAFHVWAAIHFGLRWFR